MDCSVQEKREIERKIDVKCIEFSDTITVKTIMSALQNHDILTSPRDVLVVLEIKNHGLFSEGTIENIRKNLSWLNTLLNVTLQEGRV